MDCQGNISNVFADWAFANLEICPWTWYIWPSLTMQYLCHTVRLVWWQLCPPSSTFGPELQSDLTLWWSGSPAFKHCVCDWGNMICDQNIIIIVNFRLFLNSFADGEIWFTRLPGLCWLDFWTFAVGCSYMLLAFELSLKGFERFLCTLRTCTFFMISKLRICFRVFRELVLGYLTFTLETIRDH